MYNDGPCRGSILSCLPFLLIIGGIVVYGIVEFIWSFFR